MKKFFLVKVIALILITIFSILLIISSPSISLKGGRKIEIPLGSNYEELGYKGTFMFKDYTKKIHVKNNVNPNKIGEYEIEYDLDIKNFKVKVIRKVVVKDLKGPKITLKGSGYACPDSEYVEEGYEVIDNNDGNLTDKVKIIKEKDRIIYRTIDSSGNKSKKVRKITYEDKEAPTITLNGDANINIYVSEEYNDPGYSVADNCDLEPSVEVSGEVDTNNTGRYVIKYKATDKYGNQSEAERIVNVINRNDPIVNDGRGKVIYLTFDDGPSSSITPYLLDILKEEGVKATFFVINHDDSLNYLIKREYDEGHVVALHSFTHSYSYVYSSEQNYFDDLNAIREKVHNITGIYSNLIRFPGGSSNTVSRNYNTGIMSRLVGQVSDSGYTYFDWNVSSGDAGGSDTEDEVYRSVVDNLIYKSNVVLMHDYEGNYKTLNAIRAIIHYGKQNGYEFDTLDGNSYPAHHGVNN